MAGEATLKLINIHFPGPGGKGLIQLDFKKTPEGTWEELIGMTHMRFNSEGKVIFHQDYWDPTDIVYNRIPVAKQLIDFVKRKM